MCDYVSAKMPNRKRRMPESGLYTDDGYLFYHTSIRPLMINEIERIREHGKWKVTCIRKRGWLLFRFAKENGLEYDKAPHYAGVQGYKGEFSDNRERLTFYRATLLWPKLCHNLPHRCAAQVRRRIRELFDPVILSGHAEITYSKNVPWTTKETEKLLEHYKVLGLSCSAIQEIGKLMNRPSHSCENHLKSVLARTGPIPNFLWKKLWVLVTKQTSLPSGKNLEFVIQKDILRDRIKEYDKYDRNIPWDFVAPKMVYSIEMVKDAWHQLLRNLESVFKQLLSEKGFSLEMWSNTIENVFATVPSISCEDFSRFLQILNEFTPDDTAYNLWNRKLYNRSLLTKRLEEEGIVGFYCGNRDELTYLYCKTQAILWRVNNLLFRRMKLPYSLKERTQILSIGYSNQCEYIRNDLTSSDSAEKEIPYRYHPKYYALKHGFPALHRAPFVEAFIVFSLSHFSDWIPPTAFKKYVVSEEVLSLFPSEKNNSELIRQSDLNAALSFIDCDVYSETSTSDSDE